MTWSIERKTGAVLGLAGLSVLFLAVLSYRNTRDFLDASRWVERTQEVLRELHEAMTVVANAETGKCGYIITGDEAYLEPYFAALSQIHQPLDHLRQLTADNPRQQQRLALMGSRISANLDELKQAIELRQQAGFEAAREFVASGRGKAETDQIRGLAAEMEREEEDLLRRRQEVLSARQRQTTLTASAFIALALVLLGLVYYVVRKEITERGRAERELEQFFRLTPDLLCIAGFDGYFKRLNPTWEKTLGWTLEELRARPFLDFVHPNDRATTVAAAQRLAAGGEVVGFENRYQCKDGSWRWLLWQSTSQTGEGLIYAAAHDLTERKQVQEVLLAIQEQKVRLKFEERYAELVENAAYGMYQATMDGNFVYVNPALAAMLGYQSKEELLAKNLARDIYRNPERRAEILQKALQTGRLEGVEAEWKKKDGSLITVRFSGRLVRDENGQPAGNEWIVENVTERHQLEEHYRQAHKMEALGRLTGGIAHDFNNMLSVIIGYTQLLQDRVSHQDPAGRNLSEIRKAADRAAKLTRQLLAFGRKQVLEPKVLDLNGVLADMSTLLNRVIGEDIQLNTVLSPALWRVSVDPSQIEQVIMNLAVNARDAMPQGGKLVIETANLELQEDYVQQHSQVSPGPYVMLAVSDTGAGMDAETQARIFEPFFTTKEKGKGTGLGLATVYGIVKQSGGFIWVYSEPGHGTTFKIYLPRVQREVELARLVALAVKTVRGSGTVLLVEDEAALRELACAFLEESGYRALKACDAAEALSIAQQHKDPIHLLLTDVVLPDMKGPALATKLGILHPETRVLYVSGYTDNAILHHGVLDPGTNFLQKPYAKDALLTKIAEILQQESRPSGFAKEASEGL